MHIHEFKSLENLDSSLQSQPSDCTWPHKLVMTSEWFQASNGLFILTFETGDHRCWVLLPLTFRLSSIVFQM